MLLLVLLLAACPSIVVLPQPVTAPSIATPRALVAMADGNEDVPVILNAPPLPASVETTLTPLRVVLVLTEPRPTYEPVMVKALLSATVTAL